MCSGCVLLFRIPRVVIAGRSLPETAASIHLSPSCFPTGEAEGPSLVAENETFVGEEALLRERGVEVVNLNLAVAKEMMSSFIARCPNVWNEDIGERLVRFVYSVGA